MPQIPIPKPGQSPTEKEYAVDIVFCLDSTESMQGIIDVTKDQIKKTAEEIHKGFEAARKTLRSLRARVLEFRDLAEDGDRQMVQHDWVNLTTPGGQGITTTDLEGTLAKITAQGGGGDPESSYDALCHALDSTWMAADESLKFRKIIVLFTDNPPRPLDASTKKPGEEQQTDAEIVTGRVSSAMESNELRLLVVGPACDEWRQFENHKYAKWIQLDPGKGQKDVYDAQQFAAVHAWIVKSSVAN